MIADRIRQFRETGILPCDEDFDLGRRWLTPALFELFAAQHPRDVVHSANTARWLLDRGHEDPDLVGAALVHDIGKGHQRPMDRAIYVMAGHARLARVLAADGSRFELRRAMSRTLTHSERGAELLRRADAGERVITLTARHHGPASGDRMLALLQQADAAS